MEHSAELESQLVESLNSVRTIKEFGLESYSNMKTEMRFVELLRTIYKSGLNAIFSGTSTEFLSRIYTIILLWVGCYFVVDNTITRRIALILCHSRIFYFTCRKSDRDEQVDSKCVDCRRSSFRDHGS